MTPDDRLPPLRKFAKVRLLASAMGLYGDEVPADRIGFVVETLEGGQAYEVDFDDPYDVVTVRADEIELVAP